MLNGVIPGVSYTSIGTWLLPPSPPHVHKDVANTVTSIMRPTRKNRPAGDRHHHHHLHLSLNREGRLGTTDDFATSFLHFPLFSTALWDLANCRPVHSLMLSSHPFLCLPCLLSSFTVPCKMVLAVTDTGHLKYDNNMSARWQPYQLGMTTLRIRDETIIWNGNYNVVLKGLLESCEIWIPALELWMTTSGIRDHNISSEEW